MSSSIKKSKIRVGDLVALDPETIFYTTHVERTTRVGLVTGITNSYYRTNGSEAVYAPWEGDDGVFGSSPYDTAEKIDRVTVLWAAENITTYEPADCLIKIAKVKKNP